MGESLMADQILPEAKDHVMHSMLASESITIMGSDMADANAPKGNTISFCKIFRRCYN